MTAQLPVNGKHHPQADPTLADVKEVLRAGGNVTIDVLMEFLSHDEQAIRAAVDRLKAMALVEETSAGHLKWLGA